ncbi:MAG: Ig-like domain-containing protein [Alloprevotella sp.]
MRKLFSLMLLFLAVSLQASADIIQASTTPPGTDAKPEHLYTMKSGNNYYATSLTSPTQTADNYGYFAFYAVDGMENTYYIYSYKNKKWLGYAKAGSYSDQTGFVTLTDEKTEGAYFYVENYADENYNVKPYNNTGVSGKYLNWLYGIGGQNPLDGSVTLGIWKQDGSADAGSRWTFAEVIIRTYEYTMVLPEGVVVTIGGNTYANGETCSVEAALKKSDISVPAQEGKFAVLSINDLTETVTLTYADVPVQADKQPYANAVLYPAQQEAVGAAVATEADGVFTLENNVLAASFVKVGDALYFGGSKAMNLEPGTEPFTVAVGSGLTVPASSMTLQSLAIENLEGKEDAVGGAEHFNGKALVANYTYKYKESVLNIVWKAVLRDGSHYLRTEMELTGENGVDMFDVIPMIYTVDTKAAGSAPKVVGNTRGAVLMSDKIFAGLENPVGYNTVGGASGDEDKWEQTGTIEKQSLTAASWVEVPEADVPARVTEATGAGYPDVLYYQIESLTLQENQKVEATVLYKSGNHRLNLGGADLVDANGNVAASDYHAGYTGTAKENNTFSIVVPNDGTYTLRLFIQKKSESVDATSEVSGTIYSPKEGVVVNTDLVDIQGRWSRNTTLAAGEDWKISAVVGLVAQDGSQSEENIHKTQKRRSFLAYSERERAVPWRPNPAYISWYELNINRNNAADPTQNMTADQVLDVLAHWKSDFYARYGVGPNSFVIDDGWDNYGLWTFHAGFPNEMRDIAAEAAVMGAGVGAWLGPVGGYGTSGNYRRAYWNAEGRGGMQLSNPAYYQTFLDAAENLTKNNGDFRFFKFDGISAQFSAVGPDAGDTGNENAEGIIRLERYVRENLRRDIFFNTTVGTWASPFWYHYTDATWRQENDYGTIGDNSIDRENWITYRDRLVYQNYVTNSPICPINTLMTHGFILSQYGSVSKNMTYEACLRELRCAFVCGSGMVELYNDYPLMNSINNGQLWADLAECISWQKRNADVLPDAHWVGGNPWTGAKAQVYGWASWNGTKSTLALRNGANDAQTYTFTLREALNIPANVSGSIVLHKSFGVQDALEGLTEGEAINIDTELTVTLPGSSVFAFDGLDAAQTPVLVTDITIATEGNATQVEVGKTLVATATAAPAEASFPAVTWTSSNPEIATVRGGLIVGVAEGTATITVTANDGSGVSKTIEINVVPKVVEPYYINFDKDASPSRTDRWTNKVSLTEEGSEAQEIIVASAASEIKPYFDKTADTELNCHAGETLTVAFTMGGGNWVNGYFYIDLGNDGQFNFNAAGTDITGTDVMTYSYYSGDPADDASGQNSAGEALSGTSRNTLVCPSFTAPATPGLYRVRFKVDWNSLDPAGQLYVNESNKGLIANGGVIVDAMLRVGDPSGISNATASSESKSMYDLSGRRLENAPTKGVYILNNRKVVK